MLGPNPKEKLPREARLHSSGPHSRRSAGSREGGGREGRRRGGSGSDVGLARSSLTLGPGDEGETPGPRARHRPRPSVTLQGS